MTFTAGLIVGLLFGAAAGFLVAALLHISETKEEEDELQPPPLSRGK